MSIQRSSTVYIVLYCLKKNCFKAGPRRHCPYEFIIAFLQTKLKLNTYIFISHRLEGSTLRLKVFLAEGQFVNFSCQVVSKGMMLMT